jgi:GntR family transcriptional repressor for pyruvate dehydrogenase complex
MNPLQGAAQDETPWKSLGVGGLNARIRDEILRVVRDQRLAPGDKLPSERELAALLHVSRPSAREAVRSLQAEGRLVVKHGQGVFVAEPETRRQLRAALSEVDHDFTELFDMREVLEVPASKWAAKRQDPLAVAAVTDALERLETALTDQDVDLAELQRLDAAFHLSIVEAAGNRYLVQTQNVLNEIMKRGMPTTLEVAGRIERSRVEHRRILDAILAGDAEVAGRAAIAHVRGARRAATRFHAEHSKGLRGTDATV